MSNRNQPAGERNMTNNQPVLSDLTAKLRDVAEMMKGVNLSSTDDALLVPAVQALKDVGLFSAAVHAEIEMRVLDNGQLLPGVSVKDQVKHRAWYDEAAAAELAQAQLGDRAFKRTLLSPAQMEKLGDTGKALVAIGSYKPEAGKQVVY